MWHIGPSNILWHNHLNLWKSSNNVSFVFHLGAIGGVMLARLNKLYSLTMLTFAGSCLAGAPTGGGGGAGSPPIAPMAPCSGTILPASASCNWFMNKQAWAQRLSLSRLLTWLSTFLQGVTSLSGEAGGVNKSPKKSLHFDVKVLRKLPKVSQKSTKLIVCDGKASDLIWHVFTKPLLAWK